MTVRGAILTTILFTMFPGSVPAVSATERLFAAGSLRDAFAAMVAAYREQTGVVLEPLYGPSGKLREQIQRGDAAAVFASAAIEHTDALAKAGMLRESLVLARNRLCVLARPGIVLDDKRVVDVLLDPAVRVGTSTPGADPSGDYAWAFFRNVDRERPGAFAVLSAKALQLTGGDVDPRQQEAPYAGFLLEARTADVFITYCTNAVAAVRGEPQLTWARVPAGLNVGAVYGIGATTAATPGGAAFVAFALGHEGRAILERFGFEVP